MKNKWILFFIIPLPAVSDTVFISNVPNGCSSNLNADTYLFAMFTRSQYQCNPGYYVPANTDHCVLCPDIYECNGGTFIFDENIDQGNKFKTHVTGNIANGCNQDFLRVTNNTANIIATFEPNVHECSSGYYLPANIDECTKCLNDSYCTGGTYTFSETVDQGIVSCPSEHPFAPKGMWLQSQCGRKFHMASGTHHDILYLHQQPANPTLHKFKFLYSGNNTVYYANAVLRDMTPGAPFPKVSADAERGFHAMIKDIVNGVEVEREYLFCDDSVPECRNNQ